jgi:hypothetical protein
VRGVIGGRHKAESLTYSAVPGLYGVEKNSASTSTPKALRDKREKVAMFWQGKTEGSAQHCGGPKLKTKVLTKLNGS